MRMEMRLMLSYVIFVILVIFINKLEGANTPCIYDTSPRGVIDLSSVGNQDGTPRWKNVKPTTSDGHCKFFICL